MEKIISILIIFLIAFCISFGITCLFLFLICWAFSLTFNFKIAFGIWLVFTLINSSIHIRKGE